MRLLLDTCSFLWFAGDPERLSAKAHDAIRDPGNEAWLSVVSAWEVTAKHALGRLPLPEPPDSFIVEPRRQHGLDSRPLDEAAVAMLPRLPAVHRDPFDRMLACRALAEGLVLVTPDAQLQRHPVRTLW